MSTGVLVTTLVTTLAPLVVEGIISYRTARTVVTEQAKKSSPNSEELRQTQLMFKDAVRQWKEKLGKSKNGV